ncbi:MAG: DHH family phosphoesterase [Fusobacteriaceae bacterium]
MINIIEEDVFDCIENKYSHNLNNFITEEKLFNFEKFCKTMKSMRDSKIIVLNDIDFDGFSCAFILDYCLKELNYDFKIHIGTRDKGYGINKPTLDRYRTEGYDAIICADFGIQQKDEVKYAYDIGYKNIIVIDHHTVIPDLIPEADCVINPKLNNASYGYSSLSAGGVCYVLLKDYYEHISMEYDPNKDLLRMGTMSCIADMVPLVNSTWSMVRSGLEIINAPVDKRLKKLLSQALKYKKELSEQDISFSVAPIVGSVSRLSNPEEVTVPFIDGNIKMFEKMVELNAERKKMQKEIISEAISDIGETEDDILVLLKKKIPNGICGLIASGLTQHYKRPAIVLNERGSAYSGSGRSVGNFNLLKCLSNSSGSIKSAAGHSMALGVSIHKKNIDNVLKDEGISSYISENSHSIKVIDEYYSLTFQEVPKMYEKLKRFSPFGIGNPRPKFVTKYSKLDTYFKQGNMTLIKLSNEINCWGEFFEEPIVSIKAMYFGDSELNYDDYYDIYFTIDSEEKIIIEKIERCC